MEQFGASIESTTTFNQKACFMDNCFIISSINVLSLDFFFQLITNVQIMQCTPKKMAKECDSLLNKVTSNSQGA